MTDAGDAVQGWVFVFSGTRGIRLLSHEFGALPFLSAVTRNAEISLTVVK
jgi:hypothetical protein